jgi:hypothetical protein
MTGRGAPAAALVVSVVLLAGACTHGSPVAQPPPSPGPASPTQSPTLSPSPASASPDPLCRHPKPASVPPERSASSLPAPIKQVAGEVAAVRRLSFRHPVAPEPLAQAQIGRLIATGLNQEFPPDLEARRSQAWATIGVIPRGADLHKAVMTFGSTQVTGFYDEVSGRLVFGGSDSPTPFQRLTLAHELTHALDDQHFELGRLDELIATCQDERFQAFLSLTEGDAVETSVEWAQKNLTASEIGQLNEEAGSFPPPPASIPQFLERLLLSPYGEGRTFVQALQARGGEAAVNAAFRKPPVSTEQILHPSKYPGDVPHTVEVPDLAPKLGTGWGGLDSEDVGEEWLGFMLESGGPSRDVGSAVAEDAAAGWDGGRYRAWSNGRRTVVVMETVWDTADDAREFADAIGRWVEERPARVARLGSRVTVVFASDAATLELAGRAAITAQ